MVTSPSQQPKIPAKERRRLLHLGIAALTLLAGNAVNPASAASLPSQQSQGEGQVIRGWNSPWPGRLFNAPLGHYADRAVRVETSLAGRVGINDIPNRIQSTTRGTGYLARVWVRSRTGAPSAALRIREVKAGQPTARSMVQVDLPDRSWQRLRLVHVAEYADSALDIDVLAPLQQEQSFVIDDIRVGVQPPDQEPPNCPVSEKLVPSCGVHWGIYAKLRSTTEGWAQPVLDLEQAIGRRFDLVKRYHDWSNEGVNGQFPDRYDQQLGAGGDRILYVAWTSNIWAEGTFAPWRDIAQGD